MSSGAPTFPPQTIHQKTNPSATITPPLPLPTTEYPPKADLRNDVSKPLPTINAGTVDPASMTGDATTACVKAVLATFNAAIASNDVEKLASCFYSEQAYWRDTVALTSHLRTFETPRVVAAALLKMIRLQGLVGEFEVAREAHFAVLSPVMVSYPPALLHGLLTLSKRCSSIAVYPSARDRPRSIARGKCFSFQCKAREWCLGRCGSCQRGSNSWFSTRKMRRCFWLRAGTWTASRRFRRTS